MSIEVIIKADELAAAISSLADAIKLRAKVATVDGGSLTIPAGTPLTVTEVTLDGKKLTGHTSKGIFIRDGRKYMRH